tara:strand:+ start:97 stop:621 length:525 start_codon:yes stop_codon:yes gene_type:complete
MPTCIVPLLTDAYQHAAIIDITCQLHNANPNVRLWVAGDYYAALSPHDIRTYISQASPYSSLLASLNHCIETLQVPHTVWIVSDFNEPNYLPLLTTLSQSHCITPVFVDISFDDLCPNVGWQSVSTSDRFWDKSRIIHTHSTDMRTRYHHIQSVNRSRLNHSCKQLNRAPKWWA